VNRNEVKAASIKMVLFFLVMNMWIYPTKHPYINLSYLMQVRIGKQLAF